MDEYSYGGFWIRTAAFIIDFVVISFFAAILFICIYGTDYITFYDEISWVARLNIEMMFPMVFTVFFWVRFGSTPGKMLFKLQVIDDKSGLRLTFTKATIRYVTRIIGAFAVGLGLFWIPFNKKKKGWHDLVASSSVVYKRTKENDMQVAIKG